MKRSRIKVRLLYCLVGHVSLLLMLAGYLEFSLRTVTPFTAMARDREAAMRSLQVVPIIMNILADQMVSYHQNPSQALKAKILQNEVLLHDQLIEKVPQSEDFEKARRQIIESWITQVAYPTLGGPTQSEADWAKTSQASQSLLAKLATHTSREKAELQYQLDSMPIEEEEEIDGNVRLMWLLVGSVTFFTIVMQWVISNSIIDPIQHLEDVVKRIRAGDHTIRAQLQTDDEIQTLAEAFNELARNLLANRQQLERSNEQLEHRVEEKTAELAEKNSSLEEAARLKDAFLATLSHELRTPLTPILSCAHLLKGAKDVTTEDQRQITVIERNARALSRMIDELLDLSASMNKKLTLQTEWVDLTTWARDTLETLRPTWEAKRLLFTQELPTSPLRLKVDSFRLAQILTNLVNNAVKFTETGGSIKVQMGTEGGEVFIRVIDDGAGFEQSELERIFEMFQQARNTRTSKIGGLGVGLTVARSLAELHGGRLLANSEGPGRGAMFTLWLPLPNATTQTGALSTFPTRALTPAPAQPTPLKGKHLLIIDDSVDTLDSLKRIFTRRGCTVYAATSAEEGLVLCQEHPELDMLISDIGLPGESGAQLIEKVRRLPGAQHLVAVALSGLGRDKDTAASLQAGFDTHLLKPVDIPYLEQTLVRLCQEKQQLSKA